MFKTTCKSCGAKDQLEVTGGHFMATGIPLSKDGFAFADAKHMETADEHVTCRACGKTNYLEVTDE